MAGPKSGGPKAGSTFRDNQERRQSGQALSKEPKGSGALRAPLKIQKRDMMAGVVKGALKHPFARRHDPHIPPGFAKP